MEYVSTRGDKNEKRASEAIIQGIAADRGLFVPTKFPKLSDGCAALVGKTY